LHHVGGTSYPNPAEDLVSSYNAEDIGFEQELPHLQPVDIRSHTIHPTLSRN
jgi:hypothetical protein